MKKMGDMLTRPDSFSEIAMGNTAIVRAMLESGVRVVTSYPGSPTPEIADAISSIPKDKNPLYFEFSVNEKVALEVAFGASINGHLSTVFFKSVGLNVAADSFVQLSMMELIGGMVIILGDDPGANSSQNEQDNRHFARLSYTPVFEPASPTEVYTMFKEAVLLSQTKKMPVILRLTTHICHAKEKVAFASLPEIKHDDTPKFNITNGPYIPIASTVFPLKRKALKKIKEVEDEYGKINSVNKIYKGNKSELGIIVSGFPFLSVMEVLSDASFKPDVLKLGIFYPVAREAVLDFLNAHKEIKIVEELDDILEKEIKALAFDNNLKTKIIGKQNSEDSIGEYTPDKVKSILRETWNNIFTKEETKNSELKISPRPPQLCPGCGHRSAFYAVKQALSDTDITVADIGCHSLGFLPPHNMGQMILCMGHSNGTAAGLSLFNKTRKVVNFIGDSTLFHAGLPGIINSIFNNHNHTLIIMENGTTAMTGHQDLPSVGKNFNGAAPSIPVKQLLEGLGVKTIYEVDAYNQKQLSAFIKEATSKEGFNVIIAKHPCMLKFTREQKRLGKPSLPPVEITEKCDQKHKCVKNFACPTYQLQGDGSVKVQKELCIGDLSCVQTCPSKAIKKGDK